MKQILLFVFILAVDTVLLRLLVQAIAEKALTWLGAFSTVFFSLLGYSIAMRLTKGYIGPLYAFFVGIACALLVLCADLFQKTETDGPKTIMIAVLFLGAHFIFGTMLAQALIRIL